MSPNRGICTTTDDRAASAGRMTAAQSSIAAMALIDFLAPDVLADPHAVLKRMRESAPVLWNKRHRAWIVTRYADVRAALQDATLSAELDRHLLSRVEPDHPLHLVRRWMVFQDPPLHTRLRHLVSRAFTPAVVARLECGINDAVNVLIDEMRERRNGNFVDDFAFALPAIVFSELFGIPAGDRGHVGEWSHAISAITHRQPGEDRLERGTAALIAFSAYLRNRIADARKQPGDDLLTRLVQAREAGDLLDEDELVASCMLFLFAGHDTTAGLIANGVYNLYRHPGELERLRARPDLVDNAVEEFNRYEGPGLFTVRHAGDDCEIGGHAVRAGDRVYLALMAANRDPAMFDQPDRLDITRSPNRHLGFGHGIHFCLGANLARLETRAAIRGLLDRLPNVEIDTGSARWRPELLARRLDSVDYRIT
jgi:cytochrome P450